MLIQSLKFALPSLLLSLFSAFTWAVSSEKPPAVPTFSVYHFSTKVQNSNEVMLQHFADEKYAGYAFYQWNPATGKTVRLPLPQNLVSHTILKTKQGYYFFGSLSINGGKYKSEEPKFSPHVPAVAFLGLDGKVLTAKLPKYLTVDYRGGLAILADQSILVAGGKDAAGKRLIVMGRISFANNQLKFEQLPNLPFKNDRSRYSLVGLADGRAMVLGGEIYNATGCHECLNETYFYNPKTKKWQHGPKMLERRNEATATLLPNGNVLVVGGWTPTTSANSGQWGTVSPTTEIWDAKTNQFIQGGKLLNGTTMHEVTWLAGYEGKQLLIAGGKSSVVQLYDVEQNAARLVEVLNEFQSDYEANKTPITFVIKGQHYAWLNTTSSGAQAETNWHLVSVKLLENGLEPVEQIDIKQDIVLNLYDFKFYPGTAGAPSYVVGGRPVESSTRAIWPDGRMQIVPFAAAANASYMFDQSGLPPLNSPRNKVNGDVTYQKLKDGRVIAGGGNVQINKIALADEHSMNISGKDTYQSVGGSYPAKYYEIYDPQTKQWHDSAPSKMAGDKIAVFNDGRVVKIGKIEGDGTPDTCLKRRIKLNKTTCAQTIIEMSNASGAAWRNISVESTPLVELDDYEVRPFVIQDELFLAGKHIVEIDPDGRYSHTNITQWLNPQTKQWETLWESKLEDSSSLHVGRIIFRQLANGKRVVLPVHGF